MTLIYYCVRLERCRHWLTTMASFSGTDREFRRYIGPRLRNLVQQITKRHKATVGACEHCGAQNNLESAHVAGRDRNEIIDLLLQNCKYNGVVTVDLVQFEEKFKVEHEPIEESIVILCNRCHREYDSASANADNTPSSDVGARSGIQGEQDGRLPIFLEPSDPELFKDQLLTSKRAEIEITYSDGRIEPKLWKANKFSPSSSVLGNLRSRPEFRFGRWQSEGIQSVRVTILRSFED